MEPNTSDTSNFLDWVEIKNFKSIKDLRLDCKRINVFIGKPNVGKSNILEALGLLGAEHYYGFDPTLRQFCKAMKRDSISTDPDYLRLLTDLYARQAPGILTLERILNDLITT